MSKAQQTIEWIGRWVGIPMTIIAALFTVLMFFYGSVKVTDIMGASGCDGFLVDDPSADVVVYTTFVSNPQKKYLYHKIDSCRDQIQKNPKDAVAYTNIGEAERRLGHPEAARKAYQKALDLKPKLKQAKDGLNSVDRDIATLHRPNDFKGVEAAWQHAKELHPRVPTLVPTWLHQQSS